MQKILVATDGSRGGNRAVIAAAQLAKATNAELSVITVGGNVSGSELKQLVRIKGDVGEAIEGSPIKSLIKPESAQSTSASQTSSCGLTGAMPPK